MPSLCFCSCLPSFGWFFLDFDLAIVLLSIYPFAKCFDLSFDLSFGCCLPVNKLPCFYICCLRGLEALCLRYTGTALSASQRDGWSSQIHYQCHSADTHTQTSASKASTSCIACPDKYEDESVMCKGFLLQCSLVDWPAKYSTVPQHVYRQGTAVADHNLGIMWWGSDQFTKLFQRVFGCVSGEVSCSLFHTVLHCYSQQQLGISLP